jgi:hypothetical protein
LIRRRPKAPVTSMKSPMRTSVGAYLPGPVDAKEGELAVLVAEPSVFAEVIGAEVDVVDVVGQPVVVVVVVDVGVVVEVVEVEDVDVVVGAVVALGVIDAMLDVGVVVDVVDVGMVDDVVDVGVLVDVVDVVVLDVIVEVVDVGVVDDVVDVGVVVEVVDVVVEVGQFAVVVEVVVEDVAVVPVLPVFAALAVSTGDSAVEDAPAVLPTAGDPSARTAPRRLTVRSALRLRVRNLIDRPPIAMPRMSDSEMKMSTSRRVTWKPREDELSATRGHRQGQDRATG